MRLLDIGTCTYDNDTDLSHRGDATMSLITMGVSSICTFCNMFHFDLNDRSKQIAVSCKQRLVYEPKQSDLDKKIF